MTGTPVERVSIIIPARNERERIGRTLTAVLAEVRTVEASAELIVVDDGSTDSTAQQARDAGALVVRLAGSGNPGVARNRGAAVASGDVLVFLDADCVPVRGWLAALIGRHEAGEKCVGGALALPPGLPWTARWDYYFSSYHVHPARQSGPVPNHTPANVSVLRAIFETTPRFTEDPPVADGHEELAWQAAVVRAAGRCFFEPSAVVHHHNRPGWGNLLRRTYRWAYSAIQAKSESGVARLGWLYRHPRSLIALAPITAPFQAIYIAACWIRAGRLEPLLAFPALLFVRLVYAGGMSWGGWRWLTSASSVRPTAVREPT